MTPSPNHCPVCGERSAYSAHLPLSAGFKTVMRCANEHIWSATFKRDYKNGGYKVVGAVKAEPQSRRQG